MKIKVLGRLSIEMLNLYKDVLDVKESDVILFCDYSEFDIPVGYGFSQIITKGNTILSCKVLLKGVSQQFLKPLMRFPMAGRLLVNLNLLMVLYQMKSKCYRY